MIKDNIISDEKMKRQFNAAKQAIKAKSDEFINDCVVFVYNSLENKSVDDIHRSECVYDAEIKLIKDAFYSVRGLNVILIDGEDAFVSRAAELKTKYNNVYVYSMAQNLFGVGRRCLVPILCEYYGFTNVSSNSRSSFLGGDKKLMHQLLVGSISLPQRLFLSKANMDDACGFIRQFDSALIKPNSESASIGIQKISGDTSDDELNRIISRAIAEYQSVFVEEFIQGDEVECTVIPWHDKIYVSTPIRILKQGDYLDYVTVANDQYNFEIYSNNISDTIKAQALKAYSLLEFDSIARFDFMISDGKTYLFDITPNPTVSSCSSANTAMKLIDDSDRTVYQMLLFQKLFVSTLN